MWALIFLALLGLPGFSWAAATHGQSAKCQLNAAQFCNISLPGVQAGSTILIAYGGASNRQITSVSDGVNSYRTATNLGSDPYISYTYACNSVAGDKTITVTVNSASGLGGVVAHEVRTPDTSANCVDTATANQRQTSVGTGTDAVSSGLSGLPTSSDSYIFGFTSKTCCASTTVTAGTNFTLDQSINDSGSMAWSEHYEQGAAASIAATFTQTSGAGPTFHTLVLIVKPASAPPAPGGDFFRRRIQ